MADIATRSIWSINSITQGNKRIRRAKSIDSSDDSEVEAVGEVGGEMVGFVDHPGAISISLDMRETKGKPEIDWEYLKTTKELFSMVRNVVGGRRWQYPEVRVSSLSDSDSEDGTIEYTVELVALSRKPL